MSQPSERIAMPVATETDEDVVVARIRDVLGLLGKALRAIQMYQANNPVYQRFIDALRDAFARVWEVVPSLNFKIEESGFVHEDRTYSVGEGREGLAFQFYKDGVRYLTFFPGFEDEVERFLQIIVRARLETTGEDDLVTLLWEEDFEAFQYGYVDLLAEGLDIPEAGTPSLDEPLSMDLIRADVAGDSTAPDAADGDVAPVAQPLFTRDDFKETLYFLEEDELERLRLEVEREWSRDLRTDVLNALFDRLEDPDEARQSEILGILRQLLPVFLARGELAAAARLLQELESILRTEGVLSHRHKEAVEAFFDELSEPAVIGQFIQALEDGAIDPDSEETSLFLTRLRPAAIPVLLRAVEMSVSRAVRERLQPAADRVARDHPEAIVALLAGDDEAVITGAARSVGRIRLAQATPALLRLLDRPRADTRLAAVEALIAMRSGPAMQGLIRALGDESREVRISAARGLGALRYAPARPDLEARLEGRAVREADLTEKLAFFEAYADVGGVEAVPLLDRILNGRGLLGRRQPAELRACAATALGRIATPAARESLQQAAGDPDTIVRGAVARALRKEAPLP